MKQLALFTKLPRARNPNGLLRMTPSRCDLLSLVLLTKTPPLPIKRHEAKILRLLIAHNYIEVTGYSPGRYAVTELGIAARRLHASRLQTTGDLFDASFPGRANECPRRN